jgi:hypothetical protein
MNLKQDFRDINLYHDKIETLIPKINEIVEKQKLDYAQNIKLIEQMMLFCSTLNYKYDRLLQKILFGEL